jgi:hypothetical protein
MPKALTVLEMAKLMARLDKGTIRERMKRMSYKVGKGDMIPWLIKDIGSTWAERVGFFPVTDDWYPSWILPGHELQYVKAVIDNGYNGLYVIVRFHGHDDHSVDYTFNTLVEAEVFWERLEAEALLCHTMIELLHEPFSA